MNFPQRKSIRLKNYDYNKKGAYFITICTLNRENILSHIVGDGAIDVPQIKLTKVGKVVDKYILSTNNIANITVDKYVIMPNHIHIILFVNESGTSKAPSPTNNIISHSVATLKRLVNKEIGYNIFQRSFYDHIIRNEDDYITICEYIKSNPTKWKQDNLYNKNEKDTSSK